MPRNVEQEIKMRWVLFWVFVIFFILIVLGTLGAVFLDFGNLTQNERNVLFNAFLVEIGAAVIALFYSVFGLRKRGEVPSAKVRLNLGEYTDVRKLVGKTAKLNPSRMNGESLDELDVKILDDNGPYIPFNLPLNTYSVYVIVEAGDKQYSGSFVVGTYLVDMFEEEA